MLLIFVSIKTSSIHSVSKYSNLQDATSDCTKNISNYVNSRFSNLTDSMIECPTSTSGVVLVRLHNQPTAIFSDEWGAIVRL